MRVLVIHGPNLNLLGEREPEVYGTLTLADIDEAIAARAAELGCEVRTFQSNSEGALVDRLQAERRWADAVIINPGAFTHTSYVLRDTIQAIRVPTWEVHLSDIQKREPFRRKSVVRPVCVKQISGLGLGSYLAALELVCLRAPCRRSSPTAPGSGSHRPGTRGNRRR